MQVFAKKTLMIIGILSAVAAACAWERRQYSDEEIVSRADLIVVGKIKEGSIVFVPHDTKDEGASWEYHVELLIFEVLKGQISSNSMIVSIHYGLTPVIDGYSSNRFSMINVKDSRMNYPNGIIEIVDSGSNGGIVTGDIRTNHIWLLHHVQPPIHNDSDMIGVIDPEDIQPISKKDELLKYLPRDPIDALVARLSATYGLWENGRSPVISLPATASTEQVVSNVFRMTNPGTVTNYQILKIREMRITGSLPDKYTAVLVDASAGRKIVLLRKYNENGPNAWWSRVFDADGDTSFEHSMFAPVGDLVSMADVKTFSLCFALTNVSASAINPLVTESMLKVNGKEMKDWPFIVANGPRDSRWKSLPPGGHLSFGYAMGDYFASPGIYDVVWIIDGHASKPFRIEVKK